MKKILALTIIGAICLGLSGCWRYGEGRTIGYITTIESGIFWDYVWIRAELESSQTNPYVINKLEKKMKDFLLKTAEKKQRVELYYYNHINLAVNTDMVGGEIFSFKMTGTEK